MIKFINSKGISSWHFDDKRLRDTIFGRVFPRMDTTLTHSYMFSITANGGLFNSYSVMGKMWSFGCDNSSRHCCSEAFNKF
jgi:hypothetical protein